MQQIPLDIASVFQPEDNRRYERPDEPGHICKQAVKSNASGDGQQLAECFLSLWQYKGMTPGWSHGKHHVNVFEICGQSLGEIKITVSAASAGVTH